MQTRFVAALSLAMRLVDRRNVSRSIRDAWMRDLKMESGNKEESRIARGFRASRCPRMEYPWKYARCTVTSISEEKPLTQSQAKFYEYSYKPMLAVRWTGDRETVRIVSVISRRLFRVCISTLFLSLLHREDFHIRPERVSKKSLSMNYAYNSWEEKFLFLCIVCAEAFCT